MNVQYFSSKLESSIISTIFYRFIVSIYIFVTRACRHFILCAAIVNGIVFWITDCKSKNTTDF